MYYCMYIPPYVKPTVRITRQFIAPMTPTMTFAISSASLRFCVSVKFEIRKPKYGILSNQGNTSG